MSGNGSVPAPGSVRVTTENGVAEVVFSGTWVRGEAHDTGTEVLAGLKANPAVQSVVCTTERLGAWGTPLISLLLKLKWACDRQKGTLDVSAMPEGVRKLVHLATAVPPHEKSSSASKPGLLERVGERSITAKGHFDEWMVFVGEITRALFKLLRHRNMFNTSDFWGFVADNSVRAIGIVSLISLLVGLILALVGAIQLLMFGAQIFVANLVAISMVRAMGAIMAGIIMAGRTGAAYAAQLGTMQVNEEVDALYTFGVSPIEYLVMPRFLALTLMMPLLCIYADLMGILGGFLVGVFLLGLTPIQYFNETIRSLNLNHFFVGLFMSFVFGILVSLSGCLRGMQCKRSAAAVGQAVTSAVVTSIVSIILATAIITVVCNVLGI